MGFDYLAHWRGSRNSAVLGSIFADAGSNNVQNLSNGTNREFNVATGAFVRRFVTKVRVVFDNRGAEGQASSGLTAVTLKPSIEMSTGTIVPVFGGGVRPVVVQPGQLWVSDPVTLPTTPAPGDLIWGRGYGTVASGGKYPLGQTTVGSVGSPARNHRFETGVTVTDKADSGTITAAPFGFAPSIYLIAADETIGESVVFYGDSIATGQGDSANGLGLYTPGFLARACDAQSLPWWKLSVPGEQASTSLTARLLSAPSATIAVCNWGANDFRTVSLATWQANVIAKWIAIGALGPRVYHTTTTPVATAPGNDFTQLVTQTTDGNNSKRVSFNAWLRDGAPINGGAAVAVGTTTAGTLRAGQAGHPLAGWFEVADVVENTRDSGIWKINYTADGIHPNSTAHAAMAVAVVFDNLQTATTVSALSAPNAAQIATALRAEISTELSRMDAAVSSRHASGVAIPISTNGLNAAALASDAVAEITAAIQAILPAFAAADLDWDFGIACDTAFPSLSVEFVKTTVKASIAGRIADPSPYAVEFAFVADTDDLATATWHATEWDDAGRVRLLVGPGEVELAAANYFWYVRVASSPETTTRRLPTVLRIE
jgi:lysophospholipase L1-like esterase